MLNYEQMLDKAYKELPEGTTSSGERFEIPKVSGHIQGNKTIIVNYNQIVSAFHCDSNHFLKFLLKELATPGKMDGTRLELSRKLTSAFINSKIQQYANTFVLCKTCGKPDTTIIKKEGITYMKCTACGAQSPLKV